MKSNFLAFAFLLLCTAPSVASAAVTDFIPLVGIPGIADSDLATTGFGDYINALYRLSISIAALLAVIKIVAAGAKYMLSDIVTHKEDAKKDIQGALLGLLVIIGAVIILTTINTDITKNTIAIDKLKNMDGTNHLDTDIQNLLNRLKDKEQALCDSADATVGQRCTVEYCESGDCSLWCSGKSGVYTPGSYVGILTDDVDITNKCTYLTTPEEGGTIDAATREECESRPDYVWSETTTGGPRSGGITTSTCTYTPRTPAELQRDQAACLARIPSGIWNGLECEDTPVDDGSVAPIL